ncbi:MAG: hypothetical protein OXC07_09155 [Kistimonas sp.]|nr:hypothetical protein [Kistimonas sp.]
MNIQMLADMVRNYQHTGGVAAQLSFAVCEPGDSMTHLCRLIEPLVFQQPGEGQQARRACLAQAREQWEHQPVSSPVRSSSRSPLVLAEEGPVEVTALALLGWYAAATEQTVLILEADPAAGVCGNLGWRGARLSAGQQFHSGVCGGWLQEHGHSAGIVLLFHDNAWMALVSQGRSSLLPVLRALRPLCGQAGLPGCGLNFAGTDVTSGTIDWAPGGPWLKPGEACFVPAQPGRFFLQEPQALHLLNRLTPSAVPRPSFLGPLKGPDRSDPQEVSDSDSDEDSTPFLTPETLCGSPRGEAGDGDLQPSSASGLDPHALFLDDLRRHASSLVGDRTVKERRKFYALFREDEQAQLKRIEKQTLAWLSESEPDCPNGRAPELVDLLRQVRRGLCEPDADMTQAQLVAAIKHLYKAYNDCLGRHAQRLCSNRSGQVAAGMLSAMERWIQMLEGHPFVILHRSEQQLWTDILGTLHALEGLRSPVSASAAPELRECTALMSVGGMNPEFLRDLQEKLHEHAQAPAVDFLQELEPFRVTLQSALHLVQKEAFFLPPGACPSLFHALHDCLSPYREALVAAEHKMYPVLGLATKLVHSLCENGPCADMDAFAIARARRHFGNLSAAQQIAVVGEAAGDKFLEDLTARLAGSGKLRSLTGADLAASLPSVLPPGDQWQQQLAHMQASGDLVRLGSVTPDLSQVGFAVKGRRMQLVCPQGALPVRLSPFMSCFVETEEASACTFTEGSAAFRLLHRATNLRDVESMLQPASVPRLPAPAPGTAATPGLLQPWRSATAGVAGLSQGSAVSLPLGYGPVVRL